MVPFTFVAVLMLARAGFVSQQAPPDTPKSTLERWLDLQAASVSARYRYQETSAGAITARQAQDSGVVRIALKFDPAGRYSLNAGVATGNGFVSGWNNMGPGTGEATYAWYVKQLFVAAAPVKGMTLTYGGLAMVRGESTEITSWDNDGYMAGERVSVRRPHDIFVDDLSATLGYLGDLTTASFATRAHHLDRVNYGHVLASKRLTGVLTVSADYTRWSGVGTVRTAVTAHVPHGVVDLLRYEQYRRMGPAPAFGFAAYGEKRLTTRVMVGAGYADIDPMYGGLNGDRFQRGRRVYETGTVALTPELSASIFATEAFHNSVPVSTNRRYEAIVTCNALTALKRHGLLH